MQYKEFGKFGFQASVLGFGAMRLPALADGTCDYERSVPMLRRGIDLGINYLDTAYGYINGTSEVAVGKAIKGYDRSKLLISTKIPHASRPEAEQFEARLETCLRRLDTYIDVLHLHGLTWEHFRAYAAGKGGSIDVVRKAQAQGLVRHLAFSSHASVEEIRRMIETGEFESMTVQYNLLDRHNEAVMALAHERGMGVVVMGPLAGGTLGLMKAPAGSEGARVGNASIALRFVWANPNVSVAISGMNRMDHVEENCAIAGRAGALSDEEWGVIDRMVKQNARLADMYCTGCGYCQPCPNGVNIPENFRYLIWYKVWGLEEQARKAYAELTPQGHYAPWGADRQWGWISGEKAEACLQCGECEPKCPQKIEIVKQLQEVARLLGR